MLRSTLLTLSLCLPLTVPASGFAAGSEGNNSTSEPQKTETTKDCFTERQWDPEAKRWVRYSAPVNGVWDSNIRKCIRPDKASYLDSNILYDAVREMAYAGRYQDAITVLD